MSILFEKDKDGFITLLGPGFKVELHPEVMKDIKHALEISCPHQHIQVHAATGTQEYASTPEGNVEVGVEAVCLGCGKSLGVADIISCAPPRLKRYEREIKEAREANLKLVRELESAREILKSYHKSFDTLVEACNEITGNFPAFNLPIKIRELVASRDLWKKNFGKMQDEYLDLKRKIKFTLED